MGCPIRKSLDQSLLPAPQSLSQVITSFIASDCQGIHQTPFSRLIRSRRRKPGRPRFHHGSHLTTHTPGSLGMDVFELWNDRKRPDQRSRSVYFRLGKTVKLPASNPQPHWKDRPGSTLQTPLVGVNKAIAPRGACCCLVRQASQHNPRRSTSRVFAL